MIKIVKNKLEVLFWLKKQKTLKSGVIPIYCRITINTKRCRNGFSTGIKVFEKDFDKNAGRIKKGAESEEAKNETLILLEDKIRSLKNEFDRRNIFVEAKEFWYSYKSGFITEEEEMEETTIKKLFEENLLFQQKKLESGLVTYSTIQKNKTVKNNFFKFLKSEEKSEDMPLKKIKRGMFEDFKIYLFSKGFKNNYISKLLSSFVGVFAWGVDNGFLEKNPFRGLSLRKERTKKISLSVQEVEKIENKTFEIQRLEKIKNLFLLSCYTGLAFADLTQLSKQHLCEVDGVQCLIIHRQKTDTKCVVPLIEKAKIILDKYDYNLQVPTNQKYNAYLKEIQIILGINKNLCTHTGRKTFINVMLNKYNVPSETVMKMVGHTNLKTTYHYYAEIDTEKVVKDFKNITF